MQKALLTPLFLFTSLTLFAADPSASTMVVYSANGEKFSLYINGMLQNQTAATNMRIINLFPASYLIEIEFGQNYHNMSAQVSMNPGTERTYTIERKYADPQGRAGGRMSGSPPGQYMLRLVSEVTTNENVIFYNPDVSTYDPYTFSQGRTLMDPQSFAAVRNRIASQKLDAEKMIIAGKVVGENSMLAHQIAAITKLFTAESMRLEFAKYAYTRTFDRENYELVYNSFSLNSSVMQLRAFISSMNPPVKNDPGRNYRNNRNRGNNNKPVVRTMSAADYTAAINSITEKSFESSKLTLAKQIVASNNLTAEQVKEIANLFGFESSKLEFAKYAYDFTVDKGNYFRVNDAFDFESSVSSLNQYISGR